MPLFTTSRKPCAKVRSFVKELVRLVPNSELISRGKQSVDSLAEYAKANGYPRVIVVTGMHGNPASIRALQVDESGWEWSQKKFFFKSVKLSREFGIRVKAPDALNTEDGIGFAKTLGIEPGDSDTLLKATKNTITFFQDGQEVGPRMVLK